MITAILALIGLLLMLTCQTDKSDSAVQIALGNSKQRTTGASLAAKFWNHRVLSRFGRAPVTRWVGPGWYVLTVRGEVRLWRVGVALVLIAGALQVLAAV